MTLPREEVARGAKVVLGVLCLLLIAYRTAPLWCGFVLTLPLPPRYHAAAFEGWIVEAETGAPIEDAHVLAEWDLVDVRGNQVACAHLAEAVTNRDGHFVIEGWGPRWRWPPWVRMNSSAPFIRVFKRDYMPFGATNIWRGSTWDAAWDSDWDRASIAIARASDIADYKEMVEGFASVLGWKRNCDRARARRFSTALREAIDAAEARLGRYPFN